jgi:hypothetical protein
VQYPAVPLMGTAHAVQPKYNYNTICQLSGRPKDIVPLARIVCVCTVYMNPIRTAELGGKSLLIVACETFFFSYCSGVDLL